MTPQTPRVTGRREVRAASSYVVLDRHFAAPIESVWAAVTEPDRMARWIGTWSGDPTSGAVDFQMTAEGEDCPVQRYRILACEPPHRLVVESDEPADPGQRAEPGVWRLELDLAHSGGTTTRRFAQRVADPSIAEQVGPGWEYYLDRLVAAETGGDVGTIDLEAYYPGQGEDYRALFG